MSLGGQQSWSGRMEKRKFISVASQPHIVQPCSVVAIPSTLSRIRATLRERHVLKTEHLKYAQTLHTSLNSHPAQKRRNSSRCLNISKPDWSEIFSRYHPNTTEKSVNNTSVYWTEYDCYIFTHTLSCRWCSNTSVSI